MLLNCGAGEDSWESLDSKEIQPVNPKGNQSWIFIGRTNAEIETPILWPPDVMNWLIWKRPWCWKRVKAGGEGDDRGWDDCILSLTRWTWVWASSRSWLWTGKPGVLQTQRGIQDWVTELLGWPRSSSGIKIAPGSGRVRPLLPCLVLSHEEGGNYYSRLGNKGLPWWLSR